MADKFKDAEDRMLESLFASEPIADDGFSNKALRRIRRQVWIRRLSLPIAMLIGGAIAVKPLTQLFDVGSQVVGAALPQNVVSVPAVSIPQLPVVLFCGALLVIGVLTARMLEE